MIYDALVALEDCRVLASLIDHPHVPNHITTDNRFTYDMLEASVDIGTQIAVL